MSTTSHMRRRARFSETLTANYLNQVCFDLTLRRQRNAPNGSRRRLETGRSAKLNRRNPWHYNHKLYKRRNEIERFLPSRC